MKSLKLLALLAICFASAEAIASPPVVEQPSIQIEHKAFVIEAAPVATFEIATVAQAPVLIVVNDADVAVYTVISIRPNVNEFTLCHLTSDLAALNDHQYWRWTQMLHDLQARFTSDHNEQGLAVNTDYAGLVRLC